jgi:hypothetical protein
MVRTPMLSAILLVLTVAGGAAQGSGGDRWQITLVNGDYLWDLRLVELKGDTIIFKQADTLGLVTVERVSEIRLIRKVEYQLGDPNGAMTALTGSGDEIYDFAPLDFPDKLRAVQQIFLLHPPSQ